MTEFEAKMLEEIKSLRAEVSALRSDYSISRMTFFEQLDPSAVVGVDYASWRFNCSENAVIRGRFGTDKIPKLRNKPVAFLKRNVDEVWRNLNRSVAEKAAEIRHRQGSRRSKTT